MSKKIRIGTRESQLAVWQANHVKDLLHRLGIESELVNIKSDGDIDLTTPLYAMGVQGIFTRSLDIALLKQEIDIAVHSMKDVPVQLPKGIIEAAVLERDSPYDLLVPHPENQFFNIESHNSAIVASSSLRRKAQWLYRFPGDRIEPIRGNVNTRLEKLQKSNWNAAIFASAGLQRIGKRPIHSIELRWMIPAPAQGAILVACLEKNFEMLDVCQKINHTDTQFCVKIEREFLSGLMGGCSTPIGAIAQIQDEEVFFQGNILDQEGKKMLSIEKKVSIDLASSLGKSAATELREVGADELLEKKTYV